MRDGGSTSLSTYKPIFAPIYGGRAARHAAAHRSLGSSPTREVKSRFLDHLNEPPDPYTACLARARMRVLESRKQLRSTAALAREEMMRKDRERASRAALVIKQQQRQRRLEQQARGATGGDAGHLGSGGHGKSAGATKASVAKAAMRENVMLYDLSEAALALRGDDDASPHPAGGHAGGATPLPLSSYEGFKALLARRGLRNLYSGSLKREEMLRDWHRTLTSRCADAARASPEELQGCFFFFALREALFWSENESGGREEWDNAECAHTHRAPQPSPCQPALRVLP